MWFKSVVFILWVLIYLLVQKRKKMLPCYTLCPPIHIEYHSCQWANMCKMSLMPSMNNCFPESTTLRIQYSLYQNFLNLHTFQYMCYCFLKAYLWIKHKCTCSNKYMYYIVIKHWTIFCWFILFYVVNFNNKLLASHFFYM